MWDSWHSKCDAFIDKEFIDVFISEHQLSKQIESSVKNEEVINASIRSLLKNPIRFEIDKVVFILIRLNKVREIILLLCTRFLSIQEYEKEEAKLASSRDIPIRKEFDNNREKENECILPILEILTAVYDSYVTKFGKKSVTEEYFKGILDQQKTKEQNIYDYLRIEILEKLDAKKLIDMKSEFLKDILTYDSEGLHNTILTWMIDKELFDDLERVDSPYFGKFVEKVKGQDKLNTNQISLVYKYFMKTQQFKLLINFFTPIIWSVTGAPDSRIKGECSINHRLLYIDIAQKACDQISTKTDSYQNLQQIKTALENNKTILLIQSDIENFLKSSLKKLPSESITRQFEESVKLLNTKIFKEEELIEEITKKLKLHDFTIRVLFNLVVNGDTLNRKMAEDIKDCY